MQEKGRWGGFFLSFSITNLSQPVCSLIHLFFKARPSLRTIEEWEEQSVEEGGREGKRLDLIHFPANVPYLLIPTKPFSQASNPSLTSRLPRLLVHRTQNPRRDRERRQLEREAEDYSREGIRSRARFLLPNYWWSCFCDDSVIISLDRPIDQFCPSA